MVRPFTLGRSPSTDVRTRQQQQLLQRMLNPLIVSGTISSGSGSGTSGSAFTWANLFFAGGGPPADSLAFRGDFYLDEASGDLYVKT